MKKLNKKGFTIVELVIVIAVIAILAAVLIPTFAGVINNANASAASQQARTALTNCLAMSSNATLTAGTKFAVDYDGKTGDTKFDVDYLYDYNGNKLEAVKVEKITSSEYPKIIISSKAVTGTYALDPITTGIITNMTEETGSLSITKEANNDYYTIKFGSVVKFSAYVSSDLEPNLVCFVKNAA